jgi:hypothetical protein
VIDVRLIGPDREAACIETQVERVHASSDIVIGGTQHIDPQRSRPLFHIFRHCFAPGSELVQTFRAKV